MKYKILEKNEVLKEGDEFNRPGDPKDFTKVATGIGMTVLGFKGKHGDNWARRIFRRPVLKRKIG